MLGYKLPDLPQPAGAYKLGVNQGGWVYLAGHLPFKEDMKSVHTGRVGEDFTAEEGEKFAETVGLELIASLKLAVGDLDKVKRIVKVNGYIACPPSFTALPAVLNGCSNLLGEVFEERGVHARSAVGVTSLPCAHIGSNAAAPTVRAFALGTTANVTPSLRNAHALDSHLSRVQARRTCRDRSRCTSRRVRQLVNERLV